MPQDELTRRIAGEVRHWRAVRTMSAQQLADRCTELGVSVSRSALADLENGRRPAVSVAELLAIAAALDVPPVVLVAPLGRQQVTEILPGIVTSTEDAIHWISGGLGIAPDGDPWKVRSLSWNDPSGIVLLYQRHRELEGDLLMADADVWLGEPARDTGEVTPEQAVRARRRQQRGDLRVVRRIMRELALIPPDLPPELADFADE